MSSTVIPVVNIAGLMVTAIFTFLLPIILVVFLGVTRRIKIAPFFLGAAAFFVSQIMIRIPIISLLGTQEWYISFAQNSFWVYVFILSLTAGLFEESARLGGAMILKKNRSFKDIISFGLGHGLCEVVLLVGASSLSNAGLAVVINSGISLPEFLFPSGTMEVVAQQLAAATPMTAIASIIERLSATAFHVFATVLVFKGVINRKYIWYIAAILAHTAFNFISVAVMQNFGMWASEAAAFVLAAAGIVFVISEGKRMSNQTGNDNII